MPDWTRTSNPQLRRLMLYPLSYGHITPVAVLPGRGTETRTRDLLLPKQARYQLRYAPSERKAHNIRQQLKIPNYILGNPDQKTSPFEAQKKLGQETIRRAKYSETRALSSSWKISSTASDGVTSLRCLTCISCHWSRSVSTSRGNTLTAKTPVGRLKR